MNKILYFENVTNVGNLYLQHIFNTFEYEPILFVCSDDYNNLYFCILLIDYMFFQYYTTF